MDDGELLRRFESCELPFPQWSHRTHVKIAFLYLRDHPPDVALAKLRAGIQAYNAAHDVPESDRSGYNETTTQAWLRLIHATMLAYGDLYPTPDADAFCDRHPQLLSKHLLRLFYSPRRRGHPDAKRCFVEPDLAPLPRVGGDVVER